MSKRYGRNQKRAHRQRIAELELRGQRMREVVAERDRVLADFREHLHYVAATLGHMNVLAGDTLHHMDGHDGMTVGIEKPLAEFGMLDPDEKVCIEIMRLLDVDVVRECARRNVHAIVHLDGYKSAYAISEFSLRNMPRDALKHFLTRQVAPLLCAIIAEQVSKGLPE